MDRVLTEKRIALGVTGSIACYKAVDLASKLTQLGALVDVLMTPSAARFVSPLSFRGVTGRAVFVDMFDPESETAEQHVAIARRAAGMIIAPASATTIARLANGLAEDMVSLTALATTAPVVVAPAMDHHMWEHPATQHNLRMLQARGALVVGPEEGRLASGHTGMGRLAETPTLIAALKTAMGRHGDLAGRRIVVTAGPTREAIDTVRFISNYSSGKMGFAVAEAARDRGATVTLVTGPTALPEPWGVMTVHVQTTAQMAEAVASACEDADAIVMAAAPSDFRPAEVASRKIKRTGEEVTIRLAPNPDIIASLPGERLIKVGFAAESEDVLENAEAKVARKGLAFIVANDVTAPGSGFGTDTNQVVFIEASGRREHLPLLPKSEVAHRILDRVVELLREREGTGA